MDLLGNTQTVAQIQEALAEGTLPQALLFSGPDAVGKRSLAVEMAKLAAGLETSENLLQVKPDGKSKTIRIGQLRDNDLVEGGVKVWAAQRSHHLKFVVIDDCHSMNEPATNYLLKVLEEPPQGCIFVLCTSRPLDVAATVRSRTQQFKFQRLSDEDITPACPEVCSLAKWLELSQGTFRYADLEAFQQQRERIDSWVLSLTQGQLDTRLIPKSGTLGMAEQLRGSLEAGLLVAHSLMRMQYGAPPILQSWTGALQGLKQNPLQLAQDIATQIQKLDINPTPSLLLRRLVAL